MIYKFTTIKELEKSGENIPIHPYNVIYNILAMLEYEYGADRNEICESDGGMVVYADSQEELAEAIKELHFDKKTPELVDDIDGYINTLYLRHNEYGVNFIAPREPHIKNIFEKWGIKYDV